MKWGEKLFGSREECLQYVYQVVNKLAGGVLELDGKEVALPEDLHLEYKVKYAEDPGESKFSLKIAWPNDIPMEELVDEWQEALAEEMLEETAPEESSEESPELLPEAAAEKTPE